MGKSGTDIFRQEKTSVILGWSSMCMSAATRAEVYIEGGGGEMSERMTGKTLVGMEGEGRL